MTITFQKIKGWEIEDWTEVEGVRVSMKEEKLQIAETERNIANTLSTRLLACCRTSTTKAAKVRELISGIIAQKFIMELFPDTRYGYKNSPYVPLCINYSQL